MKYYSDTLTAVVNRKGVLDVDVVKGCTAGIAAHGAKGCYQACYAAEIARSFGIDFSLSVTRSTKNKAHAMSIERAVRCAPFGFFRVGTMGDPSHDWSATVTAIEWLAPYAVPVIVTKHWRRATCEQFRRLVAAGAIINTSVSALDDGKRLWRRVAQLKRYKTFGGASVARVVSCDFNTSDPVGLELATLQERLLAMTPSIDNPLRCLASHPLVKNGIIRIRRVRDINATKTVSIASDNYTHLGHCAGCAELCGLGLLTEPDVRPAAPQARLF